MVDHRGSLISSQTDPNTASEGIQRDLLKNDTSWWSQIKPAMIGRLKTHGPKKSIKLGILQRQVGGGYGALVQKAGRVGLWRHQRPLARSRENMATICYKIKQTKQNSEQKTDAGEMLD